MYSFVYIRNMEQYLSISEAAAELGITPMTLRRWDQGGKLRPVRVPGSTHRKYPRSLIDKVKEQKVLGQNESPATRPKMLTTDRVMDIRSFIDTSEAFLALLQSLAANHEHLIDLEAIDGTGDLGVDIRGYLVGEHNKKSELVYIQSKFVSSFSESQLKREGEKVIENINDGKLEKPNKYVIACSTDIPPGQRTKYRRYIKANFPEIRVVFWCPREIDQKIKSDPVTYERFILRPVRALRDEAELRVERLPDNKQPILVSTGFQPDASVVSKDDERDEFSNYIDRAADLIREGNIEDARNLLLKTWGSIEKVAEHKHSKARILTNLGATYLALNDYRDLTKAASYFSQALEQEPDFEIAKTNLVLAYVFADENEKAWQIVKDISGVIKSKDPRRLGLHLELKAGRESIKKAIEVYESLNDPKNKELLDGDDLRRQVASLYLKGGKPDKASELLDENLEVNPDDPLSLYMKAVILLGEAHKEADMFRLNLTPRFKKAEPLMESAELLQKSYQNLKGNKALAGVIPAVLYNLQFCKQVLERFYNIHIALPDMNTAGLMKDFDPALRLQELIERKKFAEAYEEYQKVDVSKTIPIDDMERVAEIFLYHGAPEYAIRIQEKIEQKNDHLPSDHWLTKSIAEVLLDNKTAAIIAAQKAVSIAQKESDENYKKAMSHQGALFIRYPREGDGALQTMLQYDAAFPEDKAITRFNFDTDQAKIVQIMTDQRNRIEKIREQYRDQAVPVYALEKILNRPFIEIWATRGLELPFFYLDPGAEFVDNMIDILHSAKILIFDYESLLTLSKTKLLGLLNRLNKKLIVQFDTFNKIQEELIRYEDEDLRRLWEYLRKNEDVEYVFNVPIEDANLKKVTRIFDGWLLQSLQYCFKEEGAVFVTDDLRLLKLANSTASAINSFGLIQEFKNLEWIDEKRFSQTKYSLAECTYTFLQFNSDDLHEAVWQADYKPSVGNLHYVREMNLAGSEPRSFLGVFLGFILQLWKSGALAEDKVNWLSIISQESQKFFSEALKKPISEQDGEILREAARIFIEIWRTAIEAGNKDDLRLLRQKVNDVLVIELFQGLKERANEHIASRLAQDEDTRGKA